MKYYVSKYALTKGIYEIEGDEPYTYETTKGPRSLVQDKDNMWAPSFVVGVDCHEQLEDAVKAAEKMRRKKIDSLRKQVKKFEGMKVQFRRGTSGKKVTK